MGLGSGAWVHFYGILARAGAGGAEYVSRAVGPGVQIVNMLVRVQYPGVALWVDMLVRVVLECGIVDG